MYAETPAFNVEEEKPLDWTTVTGRSTAHSTASLFVLTRNDERIGVASGIEVEDESKRYLLIENFAITPAVSGRGIATIFNEEILRKLPDSLTAATIPTSTNLFAVKTAGFEKAPSQAKVMNAIAAATGLAYDENYDFSKREYEVGAVYVGPQI